MIIDKESDIFKSGFDDGLMERPAKLNKINRKDLGAYIEAYAHGFWEKNHDSEASTSFTNYFTRVCLEAYEGIVTVPTQKTNLYIEAYIVGRRAFLDKEKKY